MSEANHSSSVTPKPDSMPWLTPYLAVRDVAAAIDFYHRAFGLEPMGVGVPNGEGRTVHAEMTYRGQVIMLEDETSDSPSQSPATAGTPTMSLYLYTDGIDALYQQAQRAGATVHQELTEKFWGDKICTFQDPDGHQWTFAQRVKIATDSDYPDQVD